MNSEDQSLEDSIVYGSEPKLWIRGYQAHVDHCAMCGRSELYCHRGKQILAGYFERLENQLVHNGYEPKK